MAMALQGGTKRRRSFDSKSLSPSRRDSVVDQRIEEKKELSALNKRLELYIIAQRERAAAEGSLSSQLDALRREKRSFEKEKRQREKLLQEKASLLDEKRQLEVTVAQLKKKLSGAEVLLDQEKTLRDAERREKESNIKDLRASLASLAEEKRTVTDQLDVARQDNLKLTRELREVNKNLQQRIEEATKGEQARIASLDVELEQERGKVGKLQSALDKLEAELRTDFGKQLKEHILERQKIWDEETQKMRDLHEQKIKEKNDQLDTLHDKLRSAADTRSRIEQTVTDFKSQLRVAKTEAKAARDEKDALEKEVTDLQRELTVVKLEFTRNEKLLIDEQEKYRKERDRAADLESVNQTLEVEIKAYRLLLEDEENRLGLAKVRFSGFNVEENYFELKNTSYEDISLADWSVQSRETQKRLDLPNRKLKKDEVLKVWIGRIPTAAEKGDLSWEENVLDPTKGNALFLFDPRGVQVSYVEETPEGDGEDGGEQRDDSS